ncbi:hypothetical protein HGM15179_005530 [Zosterops borbonicus]|uniref:Uncharacterized protein n=1 Tax=Zosterops borbonicus TaxID=364589 RepID=A0A8K1GQ99_9PASS|nr:hypothetical protein HGM15179_005530 [Zosterops borbonicus]
MDSGLEYSLSKFANDTKLCGVVDMLEGWMPSKETLTDLRDRQRYLEGENLGNPPERILRVIVLVESEDHFHRTLICKLAIVSTGKCNISDVLVDTPSNQLGEVIQALLATSQNTDFAGTAISLLSRDSQHLMLMTRQENIPVPFWQEPKESSSGDVDPVDQVNINPLTRHGLFPASFPMACYYRKLSSSPLGTAKSLATKNCLWITLLV